MPIIKSIFWDQDDDNTLVYLFPFRDITLGSVLTVNDGQEAYFYKNGSLCDKFDAGRYVLSSANIPLLNKIINLPSGGESTFKASVWFVSKLEKRNLFWGAGGLRVIDPYFQVPVKMSARGQYGIRIKDGGLFLLKFIGTQAIATLDLIYNQFRADVVEAVKVSIARFMKESDMNINEIGTEYKRLGTVIAQELQMAFDAYGVELLNFNIEDINIDESDKGYQTVMEAIAEKARLKTLGVDYVQQKQIDIAQTLAGNQGAGNFMGAGVGLGVGQQMGQMIGQVMNHHPLNATASTPTPPPQTAFYVAVNGQTTGPFQLDALQRMITSGNVVADTQVYRVGGTAWTTALQEPELAQLLSAMTPPSPPPPPPGV
jgi:membrane protease subunit (stomatin/prohibitin family)